LITVDDILSEVNRFLDADGDAHMEEQPPMNNTELTYMQFNGRGPRVELSAGRRERVSGPEEDRMYSPSPEREDGERAPSPRARADRREEYAGPLRGERPAERTGGAGGHGGESRQATPASGPSEGNGELNGEQVAAIMGPMAKVIVKEVLQAVGVGGRGRSADYSAVMPDIFTEQGVSVEEYAQLEQYVKSVKLNPPERWSAEEEKKGRDVRVFLSDLKSFFELRTLPSVFWGMMARDHLNWRTNLQWDCKKESLKLQRGANYCGVSRQDFEAFMQRSFASLMPAREAKQRYSKRKQTGSVREYVRDILQVVRELQGTVFHPGGSVFDDFIDGLKPGVQRFVQDNAPTG